MSTDVLKPFVQSCVPASSLRGECVPYASICDCGMTWRAKVGRTYVDESGRYMAVIDFGSRKCRCGVQLSLNRPWAQLYIGSNEDYRMGDPLESHRRALERKIKRKCRHVRSHTPSPIPARPSPQPLRRGNRIARKVVHSDRARVGGCTNSVQRDIYGRSPNANGQASTVDELSRPTYGQTRSLRPSLHRSERYLYPDFHNLVSLQPTSVTVPAW